jgi:hypothetical protein
LPRRDEFMKLEQIIQVVLCIVLGMALCSGNVHARFKDDKGNTILGADEKCAPGEVCKCGNVDVKVGCTCKITMGSGSQSCDVGNAGGPGPLSVQVVVLSGLGGAVLGSFLTFVVMRRRK